MAVIAGTLHQRVMIFLFSQSTGHLGQSKIIESILQGARHLFPPVESVGNTVFHRDVAVFQIRVERPPSHPVFIIRRVRGLFESILPHGFVSLPDVEISDTFHIRVCQDGYGMIAYHGGRVAVPAREDGQPATLFVFMHQALHHVASALRSNQVDEGVQRPVRIPQAVILVVGLAFGQLPHRNTRGKRRITPVRVVEGAGQEGSPVERPVELA